MEHSNRPLWATRLHQWLTEGQYTHLEPPPCASEAWDNATEEVASWPFWWRDRVETAGLRVLCALFGHDPIRLNGGYVCGSCCGHLAGGVLRDDAGVPTIDYRRTVA